MAVLGLGAVVPLQAGAAVNAVKCASTVYISGTVQDALGHSLGGLSVGVYHANSTLPAGTPNPSTTGITGFYDLCSDRHDTFDVHVTDNRSAPLWADANQPYTSYSNQGGADFTTATRHPMLYKLTLTVSPTASKTLSSSSTVEFTVRTKEDYPVIPTYPYRAVTLTYQKSDGTGSPTSVTMTQQLPEGGGPSAGGWNVWKGSKTFSQFTGEGAYYATAFGTDKLTATSPVVTVTQTAVEAFYIDNTSPVFGPNGCGPGTSLTVGAFSPAFPTTNPRPDVTIGVCDYSAVGSGLNRYTGSLKICPTQADTPSCTTVIPEVYPTLFYMHWLPDTDLPLGVTQYLKWTVTDRALNTVTHAWDPLTRVATCAAPSPGCNRPSIYANGPANVGSGTNEGLVLGCSVCAPTSDPQITFKIKDADGIFDLTGEVEVKIYYQDESHLVYEYDKNLPINYDPSLHPGETRGGGTFRAQLSGTEYQFIATGFPLSREKGATVPKPSGRYIVTAIGYDYGGHAASLTWHFVFLAAE